MKLISAALLALLLSSCSSTAKSRYEQLTAKDSTECASNFLSLQASPAKMLIIGQSMEGELDEAHCLTLSDGFRTSYEIYEIFAAKVSYQMDIFSFENARGLGFGSENTIVIPQIFVLQEGSKVMFQVKPS